MKREILFRGKPIGKGGIWMVGIGAYKSHTSEHLVLNAKGDSVEVVHLCQYTGLKDKKGNKIFEGDIISLGDPNIKYLTMWRNDGFCAKQIGASSYIGLTYWASDIEVLGNVIDNPEMVKGGCNEA